MNRTPNNSSTHSLLAIRDHYTSHSRNRSRNATKKEESDSNMAKHHSFRSITKNNDHERLNSAQIEIKHQNNANQETNSYSKGITINMDIQNRISSKDARNITVLNNEHEATLKINKAAKQGPQKRAKKCGKSQQTHENWDLECTEQLQFHPRKNKKSETSARDNKFIQHKYPEQNRIRSTKSKLEAKQPLLKYKEKPILIAPNPKELLQKFEKQSQQIAANANYEALIYLDARQVSYTVRPNYIQKKQKNFTWMMRAVVVEWILQVCYQFSLKRETFYISVNLFDRFLQKQINLQKSDFQLVGAAAMFIASKLEQFQSKTSAEFVMTANGSYSQKQIKQMEKRICNALGYQLNPVTHNRWANLLMTQWDQYIKESDYARNHYLFALKDAYHFKEPDQESYLHYRTLMQFIDCSIMEIQTYQYNPKLLVCSFMYLLIGKQMEIFDVAQIPKFQHHSNYLIDEENLLNDLFAHYLQFSFRVGLRELLPIVQYCSTFFTLPQNYDQPIIPNAEQAQQTMQLQEYCSFQTFDKNMLIIVKNRARGIC